MSAWIRPARQADLPEVLALERGTPELPHWPKVEYAGYVGDGAAVRDRVLLLACTDGGLSGFVAARVCAGRSDMVDLESLVVAPEHRRRGIAGALLDEVLRWSRGVGAQTIELEVRSLSRGAIALYAGKGFVETGRRRRYYTGPVDDAVLMSAAL